MFIRTSSYTKKKHHFLMSLYFLKKTQMEDKFTALCDLLLKWLNMKRHVSTNKHPYTGYMWFYRLIYCLLQLIATDEEIVFRPLKKSEYSIRCQHFEMQRINLRSVLKLLPRSLSTGERLFRSVKNSIEVIWKE